MKKRIGSLFLALALACALFVPALASSGNSTIYLLAVNDKMCDLPGDVRPVAVNGVIYVPYSTFDRSTTGVDLGVYYGISTEQRPILTLYALSGMLTFDVKMGVCTDNLENIMNFHAVDRNGIPYVPAAAVCDFFGLKYSFLPTTDRGTLIRITSASASMSDNLFFDSAKNAMSYRYNLILQSQNPQPTAPAATASPAPTATPAPSAAPGSKRNVRVYLAVEAYRASQDLSAYYANYSDIRALFLYTPDSLAARAGEVRRAVAAGHAVGLVVTGTAEEARQQLARGNELLGHIARINTHIVSAPAELVGGLEAEGWVCWQSNVSGSDIMGSLDAKRAVGYVNAPLSPAGAGQLLSALRTAGYDVRLPLETELG